MNLKEIMDLTKNRIDELDIDSQVDIIIKEGINHAYMFDLSKIDSRISMAYCPAINGIITLPDDCNSVIKITPELNPSDRRTGNSILTNLTGTFNLIYSIVPEPLINDTDIPELNTKYHYLLSTYACYAYYEYRKKGDIANMFLNNYEMEKQRLFPEDNLGEEIVNDTIGGDSYAE